MKKAEATDPVASQVRYSELQNACRLWIAACEARDLRIEELEAECHRLRQRVARLSRQIRLGGKAPAGKQGGLRALIPPPGVGHVQ